MTSNARSGSDNSLQEIAELLGRSQRILTTSHYNPDTDALGSSCALTLELKRQGREVQCLNESRIVSAHSFIPGVVDIVNDVPPGSWDCLVVCDCGELRRTGDILSPKLKDFPLIVNLDHHVTNDRFGHYNYVRTEAAATSEIVFDLLTAMGIRPGPEAAFCLFAGLSGDTGSFRYTNTNGRSFELARSLVDCGASPSRIADFLHGRKPVCQVKLEAAALLNLESFCQGRLSWVAITQEMYDSTQSSVEHTENIVDFARDIAGVLVAVAVKRDRDLWRVSLRGKNDDVNLAEVAAEFGGGGHRCAAAFRWRKSFDELKSALLNRLMQERALA